MSLSLADTKAVLQAVDRATEELGFCRNRVWAIAKSLPGGPSRFPELLPSLNMPLPETKREDHQLCAFDFCEQSRVNFTLVTQRHEPPCKGDRCDTVNFPSTMVEEAVREGQPVTAWDIDWDLGKKELVQHNERYMAISHVWSDGTGAGSQARGDVNTCLVEFFRRFARDFECKGLWWDTICIPTKKDLREKALKRMHLNYKSAAVTLVHDCFLRECEWRDADLACFHIIMSPWFSRGWTALELKMSQKVQIIFKGLEGPITKDLDRDILQAKGNTAQIAKGMIERLRMEKIDRLDLLLAVLGPRHTSWPRDMAIISGLMIEIELPEDYAHQKIYQEILQALGQISPAHLFHNSGTMAGGYNWCPTDIYDLPTTLTSRSLQIEWNGNLLGEWGIFSLDNVSDERVSLGRSHPLIEGKVRLALEEKDRHILLVEEQSSAVREISRGLLVEPLVQRTESHLNCYCDYIGPVYFHPPLTEQELKSFDSTVFTIHVGHDDVHRDHQSSEDRQTAKSMIEDMKNSSLNPQFRKREDDSVRFDITNWNGSKLWGEFMKAATDGDYEAIEKLLEVVPDPTGTDPLGNDQSRSTALHVATWNGHSEVVKLILAKLLAKGVSAQQKNAGDEEPLHLASERGNEELVCTLRPYSTPNLGQEDGLNVLHLAAKYGFTGIVNMLLREKWDINAVDSAGQTALHMASYRGHDDVVDALIKQGADQGLKDDKERTAFSLAVFQDHEEIARLLKNDRTHANSHEDDRILLHKAVRDNQGMAIRILARVGVDLEAQDDDGWTALHITATVEEIEPIKILAELKANLEAQENRGRTPLHIAAAFNVVDGIKILAELGANLHAKDEDPHGETPFHEAVINDSIGAIKILAELGANLEDQDYYGRTQLHWATVNYKAGTLKTLHELGVYIEGRDKRGQTPLHRAASNDAVGAIMILVDIGAKLEAPDDNGQTPLHTAAMYDAIGAIKILAELEANLEARGEDGQTPLHRAAATNKVGSVKRLAELGADLEAQDNNSSTPLHLAASYGAPDAIKMLAECGANLEHGDNDSQTPFHRAVICDSVKAMRTLTELGADIQARDSWGWTPLHKAASSDSVGVIKLLVELGAILDALDNDGRCPIHWAAMNKSADAIKMLAELGADIEARDFSGDLPLQVAKLQGCDISMQVLSDLVKARQET